MASSSRGNRPCGCGSGKNFKKCCLGRKPRARALVLDFGKPQEVDQLELSPTGELKVFSHGEVVTPVRAYAETTYERPKGPKILNHFSIDNDALTVNGAWRLQKYDLLYAIDTNTKILGPDRVSVAAVLLCKFPFRGPSHTLDAVAVVHCLEFRNVTSKPENVAWRKMIELVLANPGFRSNWRVGLIVDCDLGALSAYNARELPIVEGFYLPSNFELSYASGEVGQENFANKLLAMCHKAADEVLEYLRVSDYGSTDLLPVEGQPYTHFRFWTQ